MLMFLKAIGAILVKAQVGSVLLGLGGFAAALALLAGTIKTVLPSAPVLTGCLAILIAAGVMAWYLANQFFTQKAVQDIQVAEARTKAAKAEREMFAAKARAQVAEAADDN